MNASLQCQSGLGRWGRAGAMLVVCLLGLEVTLGAAHAHEGVEEDPQVRRFIDDMSKRHGFARGTLLELFRATRVRDNVLKAMSRPAEAKPWYEYRPMFVTPSRIRGGIEFWREHRKWLERAAAEYRVDPEFIVAIIGVETRYGQRTGRIRVLDALTTLAFRYPRRASFFRSELEHFLLLTREEGLDPLGITGSYAGAMGLPQFIASSYRRYAVDFDDDGVRDLLGNTADAIGSVAHYLQVHGWRSEAPVAAPAVVETEGLEHLVERGIKPHTPVGDMRAKGVRIDDALPNTALAALIELQAADGKEYWLGLQNFYTITRYNHSALYAMAVYQLAQAIREGVETTSRSYAVR